MAYQVTAVKIMIASPSDVSKERQIVRDAIHDWNDIHSEDRGLVLMPVGWESHSSPELGDRPQAIINEQLKNCDILVAVFWTRLGSPTGTSPSGTVEEIEEHLRAGKPAMIYFSSEPVHPDSVDSQQYAALKAFKEDCRKRGIIDEYESASNFHQKFTRHLTQTVIRNFGEAPLAQSAQRDIVDARPSLSQSSQELLIEAAQDPNGTIMKLSTFGGTRVQTNRRNFTEPGNPRSEAQWASGIDQLLDEGLIEDRNGKGEAFSVTGLGYDMADTLRKR